MNPRVALIIGAVAAAIFGLLLALAPATMLSGFGLRAPDEAVVLSRDVGVTLLGLAVINWMARDASGTALRAILVGNIVIQVLEFLVNGYELAIGQLPTNAAGGEVIHVVLGVIFVLGLLRAPTTATARV